MGEYSNLIESNLVDEVFYQIPEILGHHESILDTLEDRLSNWDSKQKVGDVFVDSVIIKFTFFVHIFWDSKANGLRKSFTRLFTLANNN